MPNSFSQKMVNSFDEVKKIIASICDTNGDGQIKNYEKDGIKYDEVGIFNSALASINKNEQTFEVFGDKYDFSGKLVPKLPEHVEVPDKTRVEKEPIIQPIKSKDVKSPKPINKIYNANSQLSPNEDIEYDVDSLNNALSKVIKSKNSLLLGTAKDVIKYAKQKKIDPFIMLGIAMCESAEGTYKRAKETNNVGGLMATKGGLRKFNNVSECLDSMSTTLHNRYYGVKKRNGKEIKSKPYKTLSTLGASGTYCATGVAEKWSADSAKYAESLRNAYNIALKSKT